MILNELKEQLSNYEVKQVTKENINDVYKVMKNNKYFISRTQKHEVTIEECIEDINSIPPGIEMDKKTYVAVYDGDKCIALIDFVEGFPEENIGFIGLFVLDVSVHRKGISKKIFNAILEVAKKKFDYLGLGCYETNQIGFAFWIKMGFEVVSESERETDDEMYTLFYMQRKLN